MKAMKAKIKLMDEQGRKDVKALLAGEEQAGLPKAWLMAVRLAFTGRHSFDEIAELTGMGRSWIVESVRGFRTVAVQGFLNKPSVGVKEISTQVTRALKPG